MAQSLAEVGTFNQTWHFGHDEPVITDLNRPQHRLDGGEWIIGYLGPGR